MGSNHNMSFISTSTFSSRPSLDLILTRPPSYLSAPPSLNLPDYHPYPLPGEECIQASPLGRPRRTGTYQKKSGSVTLILTEQPENTSSPSYGNQGQVNGVIVLEKRDVVSEVYVKLEGEMNLVIPDQGAHTMVLFEEEQLLWKTSNQSNSTSTLEICPSQIPFSCRFPETFMSPMAQDQLLPLPPSLDVFYPGSLLTRIKYRLKIKVVQGRRRQSSAQSVLGFLGRLGLENFKILNVPIDYLPHTRPPYSVHHLICGPLSVPGFLSDLKRSPDEWVQSISSIKSSREDIAPCVDCHLFIPSIKIFSLADTIPFHIILTGPIRSLQEFVPSSCLPSPSPSARRNSSRSATAQKCSESVIYIYILRQICAKINNGESSAEGTGVRAVRNIIIGHGVVREVPPSIDDDLGRGDEGMLKWEGELSIITGSLTSNLGTFDAGGICLRILLY
ncbi:hypothetical protein D9758_018294 [Tetrapyrgos nigripes]|uniref:Uncharacterized protein n=1 Tax=Tetrapyrgos nigripes TaxID=182062 RepID=A0A8H5EVM4_9AGAR|nr:hypothetical protein D9758_018294 [Tetrapyrgos nigripes]